MQFRLTAGRARRWWRALAIAGCLLVALGAAVTWFLIAPRKIFSTDDPRLSLAGNVEKGRAVFAAGDCASCHARPGQPDRLLLGGGLALASPYGTFRVPNISPDPKDGIGAWTTADLANALIAGVSPDGRHYYPSFPYPSFTGMTLQDVVDLMAYLRTLAPAEGAAPPHDIAAVFRIRRFVGFWKLLYFDPGTLMTEGTKDDPLWQRGRYLVEAVAHCAECHASRDVFGGIKPHTRFAGGPDQEGTGYIPNITPARIAGWSEQGIAELLSTGRRPDGRTVGSSMKDVVVNTSSLPQADRDAIARYIKSLPPRPVPRP